MTNVPGRRRVAVRPNVRGCPFPTSANRARGTGPSAMVGGVTRSPFDALTRRVDAHDETLRALADTVVDIKDVVDGHTEVLAEHSAMLAEHSVTLAEHSVMLAEHSATLAEHSATLTDQTAMLREILRRLPPPS